MSTFALGRVVLIIGAFAGCSQILDFDDENGLLCPCTDGFVCLNESNRCAPQGSVDLFKSCALNRPADPSALCPDGAACVERDGRGPRCLPTCTPTTYATPESGQRVAEECPAGTACFTGEDGAAFCDEGECVEGATPCAPGQSCINFNGAGICFTPCNVFDTAPAPCVGNQVCQPIGVGAKTACVPAGSVSSGDVCSETAMCTKFDASGATLACDRAAQTTSSDRRCYRVCDPAVQTRCEAGVQCTLSRPNVTDLGQSLGLCGA